MPDTVAITRKPSVTLKALTTPAREAGGSYKMTSTFVVGAALVSEKSDSRATAVSFGWKLSTQDGKKKSTIKSEKTGTAAISASVREFSRSCNINSFNGLTRASFYPHTSRKLLGVSVWARPYNSFGNGETVSQTRKFLPPEKPTIGAFSVNEETGVVSCTITSNAGNGYRERRRTRYQVIIHNTKTKKKWTNEDSSFTALSHTVTYNAASYQQLEYGDYIQVTVRAWNQGFAGDSNNGKPVERTYYMSYPAVTTISKVSVSSRAASGKCTVVLKTNSTAQHPVDRVSLEYLPNSDYAKASTIPGDTTWTDAQIVDDAKCTALAMPVANLIPDPGKYTWVRVKSEHAIPDVLYRYSEPKRVKGLETPLPSAADDDIKILGEPTLGVDGESLVVSLGWNADGQDDSTGTELSWADAEDAWRSTDPPETFEFTWSDGSKSYGGVTYNDSATITIKNLDAGQTVFIRARRFLDANGERTYGDYCNAQAQMPSSAVQAEPESVALSLPGFVAAGSAALASWTLSSPKEQLSWQLRASDGTVIADNDGIANNFQIPFDRLESLATDGTLELRVEVSTGGDVIVSDYKSVTIVSAPTVAIGTLSTLTAQPLSFDLTSNVAARIIATITAAGIGGQNAGGDYEQHAGDCVWSVDTEPIWTESSGTYSTTITLDDGQPLLDGCEYTLEVQAIDLTTGLKSAVVSADFDVSWLHQAVAPDSSTVTPSDYVDSDGVHHITATVGIVAPTGAAQTDVYDVYRCTADGAQLIGAGYPGGASVVDEYAPFGSGMSLFYRIATRTVDGDEEFADVPYQLGVKTLRFDWPFGTLELPYNIEIDDSYSKNVTFRNHMDGAYSAYWNQGVKRTAKYSSQLIRLDSQEDVAAARQLARYPGGVFVRTPDGSAFEADVQISDMSTSGVMQLFSLTITEIEPTGSYDLPPYEEADDEQEEA